MRQDYDIAAILRSLYGDGIVGLGGDHRGTANSSDEPRPMLIIGVVADDVTDAAAHQLEVTADYLERLPAVVREHLFHRLTDTVGPLEQRHMIEGLLEGAYD